MSVIIYKSLERNNLGLSIQEEKDQTYTLWVDEYEGGECYISDWIMDENAPHNSFNEVYNYLLDNYGRVKILKTIK